MNEVQVIVAPIAVVRAKAIVTDVPLSFWGGVEPRTGSVIDQRHPLCGVNLAGRVLVLPRGRGSCSASGVILECIHAGTAPAAIATYAVDPIIGLGAILADEIYGETLPVLVMPQAHGSRIRSGDSVMIGLDGRISVESSDPRNFPGTPRQ